MKETLLPAPSPDVIFGALSDGAVLFATESEVYFGLNATGACVWELLPPARNTVEEVCAELQKRFPEVPSEVIRADLEELLDQLVSNGLAVRREIAGPDAEGATAAGP